MLTLFKKCNYSAIWDHWKYQENLFCLHLEIFCLHIYLNWCLFCCGRAIFFCKYLCLLETKMSQKLVTLTSSHTVDAFCNQSSIKKTLCKVHSVVPEIQFYSINKTFYAYYYYKSRFTIILSRICNQGNITQFQTLFRMIYFPRYSISKITLFWFFSAS